MVNQTQQEAEKIAEEFNLPPPPLPPVTAGGVSINPVTSKQ